MDFSTQYWKTKAKSLVFLYSKLKFNLENCLVVFYPLVFTHEIRLQIDFCHQNTEENI